MQTETSSTKVKAIGANKAVGRIQVENQKLHRAGFVVGARYDRVFGTYDSRTDGFAVLSLSLTGAYVMAGNKGVPVLDIKCSEALELFGEGAVVELAYDAGQITLVRGCE